MNKIIVLLSIFIFLSGCARTSDLQEPISNVTDNITPSIPATNNITVPDVVKETAKENLTEKKNDTAPLKVETNKSKAAETPKQTNETLQQTKKFIPGPGGCPTEQACFDYCFQDFEACQKWCNSNPSHTICQVMQNPTSMKDFKLPTTAVFDPENEEIPKFVKHNFIELDKIDKISKFRSGYGHDFSEGTEESCRSMKHYLWPKGGEPGKYHDSSWMKIKYFAPVNGTIKMVSSSENTYGKEARFFLESDEYPAFSFRFFHVKLLDHIKPGTKIIAGQQLGTIGDENTHGEIAVQVITQKGITLISFFEVASDDLFNKYKMRGANIDELIITKQERDANPLQCDTSTEDGRFIGGDISGLYDSAGLENWVILQ